MTTTNDMRRAAKKLHAEGLNFRQIATRLSCSVQMARTYAITPEVSIERRVNHTMEPPATCADCGASPVRDSLRCRCCENARRKADVAVHVAAITAHALDTGWVPTVSEAAGVTGLSRSRAGDIVLEAFGPNPYDGPYRQRLRPWPDRELTKQEIETMDARMRENQQAAGKVGSRRALRDSLIVEIGDNLIGPFRDEDEVKSFIERAAQLFGVDGTIRPLHAPKL